MVRLSLCTPPLSSVTDKYDIHRSSDQDTASVVFWACFNPLCLRKTLALDSLTLFDLLLYLLLVIINLNNLFEEIQLK
jgi:hypothetical protein